MKFWRKIYDSFINKGVWLQEKPQRYDIYKNLFEPLGITEHKNYYVETAEEHKAFTIGKTPKENIWFSDPDGLY